jgi:hypothetical protein
MRNHLGQADERGNESRLKTVVCEIMKRKQCRRFDKTYSTNSASVDVLCDRPRTLISAHRIGVNPCWVWRNCNRPGDFCLKSKACAAARLAPTAWPPKPTKPGAAPGSLADYSGGRQQVDPQTHHP